MPTKVVNQDLEHQREKTLVNDTGVKVTPQPANRPGSDGPPGGELPADEEFAREDRAAEEAVRKLEESLAKLPPG